MGLTILKIGGSVLTEKDKEKTARMDEIERVCDEIASFMQTNLRPNLDRFTEGESKRPFGTRPKLVLIHGAGSYGHPQAKKGEGLLTIHESVKELNRIILDSLRKRVPCVPVHPLSCSIMRDGRLKAMMTEQIEFMLGKGIIPVLHGDVVMDELRGTAILSGDQLVTYLATTLMATVDRVGVGTNTDVVIEGKKIERITHDSFQYMKSHIEGSGGLDVTGGMSGKINELLDLASHGIASYVFDASKADRIYEFLLGENVGTIIDPKIV
jgi:isopentenyl phosphate kinase